MKDTRPIIVFDAEADGLLDTVTRVYCLSYKKQGGEIITLRTEDEYREFFSRDVYFCGHNVVGYDRELFKKIYGIEVPLWRFIDTQFMSQYLNEHFPRHSLESLSIEYGIGNKVEIEDWGELPQEKYEERCEKDVELNFKVFEIMFMELWTLYKGDRNEIMRLLAYLTYKAKARVQWTYRGIKIDVDRINKSLEELEGILEDKRTILATIMPPKADRTVYSKPKTTHKADGTPTKYLLDWQERLNNDTLQYRDEDNKWINYDGKIPKESLDTIRVVTSYSDANPGSSNQVKDWLFKLGWNPCTYSEVKKNGKIVRRVPQVSNPSDKTELVDSIKILAQDVPEILELSSYTIIRHRIGKLKALLKKKNKADRVFMGSSNLTSTMRIKHKKPLENMPKPYKPYASAIRSSLVAGEGNVLIGADLSSIEDKTKRHLIYDLDPEYVKLQESDGFDPHIDIGKIASLISEEEAEFYMKYRGAEKTAKDVDSPNNNEALEFIRNEENMSRYNDIDHKRDASKIANFSCLPVEITEVLTTEGWKCRKDLRVGDKVHNYNTLSGEMEEDTILLIIDREDIVYKLDNGRDALHSTENHRWYGKVLNQDGVEESEFFVTREITDRHKILKSVGETGNTYIKGHTLVKTDVGLHNVFCIVTKNSTFVIRQGNTVTITGNCTYGAGAPAVSAGAKIPLNVAETLVTAYRRRNWAVDVVCKNSNTREVNNKIFIYAPISGFWMRLRHDKDRLSAINQSSAVYVFDMWAWQIRTMLASDAKRDGKSVTDYGYHIPFEYHDEVLLEVPKHRVDRVLEVIKEAGNRVNDRLKLNVVVNYGVQVGHRYSEVS